MIFAVQATTAALCALISCAAPVVAQNIVGTTVVDGKKVRLFSDKSWEFESPADKNCKTVNKQIQFCGPDILWKQLIPDDERLAAQFQREPTLFLSLHHQAVGERKGVEIEKIRKLVVRNVAKEMGVSASNVLVFFDVPSTVSGFASTTMAYSATIDTQDIVYMNTIVIGSDWTVQVLTTELGETAVSEKHKFHHKNSLKLTKLAK